MNCDHRSLDKALPLVWHVGEADLKSALRLIASRENPIA
jgi:hypothetical protein